VSVFCLKIPIAHCGATPAQRFIKKYEKQIEDKRVERVPASLDLRPYRDEKDFESLQRMVQKENRKH
jgi:hypothetical protein